MQHGLSRRNERDYWVVEECSAESMTYLYSPRHHPHVNARPEPRDALSQSLEEI